MYYECYTAKKLLIQQRVVVHELLLIVYLEALKTLSEIVSTVRLTFEQPRSAELYDCSLINHAQVARGINGKSGFC